MTDFYKECMNTAVIRNPEFLDLLNQYSDLVQSINVEQVRNIPTHLAHSNDFVSEEYMKSIVYAGRTHAGYPEECYGFELSADRLHMDNNAEWLRVSRENERINNDIVNYLGAHRRALSMVYPPGGFIGWHNNANASGYNVIFTWSSEGEGEWQHIDPVTKEHVRIPDVKGWQCKYGYYGSYNEMNRVLYHAASTNCLRATIGFVFDANESGKSMAEMVIEEIETV